jgi:hypothetical protein
MSSENSETFDKAKYVGQQFQITCSDELHVSEDKLLLFLSKNRDALRATGQWTTPLSLALTLLIALVSIKQMQAWGPFTEERLWALFLIGFIASFCWFVKTLIGAFRAKVKTPEQLVEELKDQAIPYEQIPKGSSQPRGIGPWTAERFGASLMERLEKRQRLVEDPKKGKNPGTDESPTYSEAGHDWT